MKKTEIGVIPEEWEVKELGEVLNIFSGFSFKSSDSTSVGAKWLKIANVGINKVDWHDESYLPESYINQYPDYVLKENDIVLALTRPLLGVKLKIAEIKKSDGISLLNQRVGKLITEECIKFIYYLFQGNRFISDLNNSMLGTDPPNISINNVYKFKIPLPPLAEQEAIASALSDVDAWIDSLEQLIAKKRLIKQGAMQTLLTPQEDWEVKKLGEVGKTYGGLSGKTKVDFGKGNAHYIPFMNVMKNVVIDKSFFEKVNLKQGEVQNKVLKNDLLFNGSSETPEELGISSVILEDIDNLYLNSFCFGFRLFDNNVNPLFLSYLFRSPYGRKIIFYLAQGATRYNLSKANFLELEISIPKSLSEQERIATILSDMDAELEALEAQLAKARLIKQGMMQELLTGRTRLV